jgi:hypothetical protein
MERRNSTYTVVSVAFIDLPNFTLQNLLIQGGKRVEQLNRNPFSLKEVSLHSIGYRISDEKMGGTSSQIKMMKCTKYEIF